ncbi:hypothetical protein BDR03DRAFT_982794 [Suillus americanus]|nr:hypothetical protein BDR03DRAFT_982794 [Suillus americanus]
MASHGPTPPTLSSLAAVPSVHSDLDTFKTEYHPHSGHATSIETFSAFGRKQDQQPPIVDEEPWQPFSCCADFEFAELAHNAALNKDHMDELLWLIWRIADGQAKLTFKSHRDVSSAWDRAAGQMTPDPLLAPHFVWDAQRLYKHDGTHFECFFHEPWTVDRWWNVQSYLPENGVPFAFMLYADKTHLSSTGMVKAYPVFTRCGNLPVHIRNTDGLGGRRMVGWLPIVPKDSEQDGKLMYVNLKQIVWHEGFLKLLETIILYAQTGDKKAGEEALRKQGLRPVMGNGGNIYLASSNDMQQLWDTVCCLHSWRNLNHFDRVTNITYSDGNKLQDISKNVLMCTDDEAGYALLWCIASYLHIDMYVSLNVHTMSTIEGGKAEVLEFQTHLETNRKDIASQILELGHKSFIAEFIRSHVVFLDEERHKLTLSWEELEEEDDNDEPFEAHLHIGSPLRNLTSLAQVEEDNRSNRAVLHDLGIMQNMYMTYYPTYT